MAIWLLEVVDWDLKEGQGECISNNGLEQFGFGVFFVGK